MDKDNTSFTNEYSEYLEFLRQMQEAAHLQSDAILSEKKELEYKKREQEYLVKEQEKQKVPNISMFSPLSSDDLFDGVSYKDDLQATMTELASLEEQWQKQNEVCVTFERLKKFISDMEVKMQKSAKEVQEARAAKEAQKNKIVQEIKVEQEIKDTLKNVTNDEDTAASEKSRPVVSSAPAPVSSSQLIDANDNLINYSTKLLKTQEMDRNRISRDLHDSTVQSLTSFGHKLEYCCRMVEKDPVKVKLELQTLIDLNKQIINDMREIIYDLRPMSLNNIGFVSSVEAYCQHIRRNDNFDVVLKVNGPEKELGSITSVTLFRILQEACNNSLKHSKAKKVYIRITYTRDTIDLDVDDDGVGFNLDMVEEQRTEDDFLHGFGLSTMRERAKLLSGTFSIRTRPGFGTKIHVSVPLIEEDVREEFL